MTIDIVKGCGIVLMVCAHAGVPCSKFISLFHMALFFIASGCLYNPDKIKDVISFAKYILNKLRSLWLPFVLFSSVFVLCNNLFLKLNIYTDNPDFLKFYVGNYPTLMPYMTIGETLKTICKILAFHGNPQLGGALWFLQTLFCITVGYAFIDFFIRKITLNEEKIFLVQGIIAVVLLAAGYFCSLNDLTLGGINKFCSYYCLYYLGILLKRFSVMDKVKMCKSSVLALTGIGSFVLLFIMRRAGASISIVSNKYVNPLILLAASMLGWMMMYVLSALFVRWNFKGNSFLAYASKHAVPVIGLHFLTFKIVNLIAVMACGMDNYMIAAFPVVVYGGAWWALYTVVGLSIPLLLYYIAQNILRNITRYGKLRK